MEQQVSRSLYRAVLRFARHSRGVPWQLSASEARAAVPLLERKKSREEEGGEEERVAIIDDDDVENKNLGLLRRRLDSALEEERASSSSWDSSTLVKQVARIAAEAGREITAEEEEEKRNQALDAAFRALRSLNGEHARSVAAARASRAEHSRRQNDDNDSSAYPLPKYKVGQVFVHKKFGYRAVIIGWDRGCAKGAAWAKAVNASTPHQPFYSALPSEDDCVSLFGAARASKYVAEENVDVETLTVGGRRVTHPLLRSFFDGWSEEEEEEGEEGEEEDGDGGGKKGKKGGERGGRYLGNARLRYEFPDDFDDRSSLPTLPL